MAWMPLDFNLDELLDKLQPIKAGVTAVAIVLLKILWNKIIGKRGNEVTVENHENNWCLIKGCIRPLYKRGLCAVCYGKAKKKVDNLERSWDELVEMGLARSEKDPFDDAYSKATGE